jgi:hypothetical protein
MRAAILAVLFATQAHAAWNADPARGIATQTSADQTALVFVTCDGAFSFVRAKPANTIRFRIDGNTRWTLPAEPKRADLTAGTAFVHASTLNSALLIELQDGMALGVHWGDDDFDRFSLMGFAAALEQLACQTDNTL